MSELKIVVLVENTTRNELLCEHGLSFYIEDQNYHYLLDAGQSDAYMKNAKLLNIDLNTIHYAILSHGHYDHGNGFLSFIETYHQNVYAMNTSLNTYYSDRKGSLREIGLNPLLINKYQDKFILIDSMQQVGNASLIPHSTRMLSCIGSLAGLFKNKNDVIVPDDFDHELTLVMKTSKGLVVVNSCSHAGMVNIIEEVKRTFPNEMIYAYIGGLHLKKMQNDVETCLYDSNQIRKLCNYLKENEIQKIYCGHCSGQVTYDLLKEQLQDMIEPIYSGCVIEV